MPQAPRVEFVREKTGVAPIAVRKVTVSRSHGISPAAMHLEIVPLNADDLAYGGRQGYLEIEYDGVILRLVDCIIDSSSILVSPDNRVNVMTILDHRWQWQFGSVSGHYNRRSETGKLIGDVERNQGRVQPFNRERSVQYLADLLLYAMGDTASLQERSARIASLPETVGPEVRWDHDNPARELAWLCDMFGCRIVMDWDNSVRIFALGQARNDAEKTEWPSPQARAAERRAQRIGRIQGKGFPPLPTVMPVIGLSESLDSVERPASVIMSTAPMVFQWDFELEAVGEDTDGAVKLLKDLSYAPDANADDGGFGGADGMFSPATGLNPIAEDEDIRRLAAKSVFRWYQVKTPFTFPATRNPEGGQQVEPFEVETLSHIRPIIDAQVATEEEDGLVVNRPSVVYGQWMDSVENNVSSVVPLPEKMEGRIGGIDTEKMIIPSGWYVDTRKAIVKFRQPIVRIKDDAYAPAILRLRAAFQLRDDFYGNWITHERRRNQPPPHLSKEGLPVRRMDLIPVFEARWVGRSFNDVAVATNIPEVDKLLDEHIDAIEKTFTPRRPSHISFAGFHPQIQLDGVIRTVSFRIDVDDMSAPITTMVELDQDVPGLGQLGYVELRQHQRILQMRDRMNILTSGQWRRRLAREEGE